MKLMNIPMVGWLSPKKILTTLQVNIFRTMIVTGTGSNVQSVHFQCLYSGVIIKYMASMYIQPGSFYME